MLVTALLKAAAYRAAPRATFTVLHPVYAAQLAKVPVDLRTAYAPRLTGALGLAIGLPLGILIGRMLERRAQVSATPAERPRARRNAPPRHMRERVIPRPRPVPEGVAAAAALTNGGAPPPPAGAPTNTARPVESVQQVGEAQ